MLEKYQIRETNKEYTEFVIIAIAEKKVIAKEILNSYKKHHKKRYFVIKELKC
jgi:hypothetical protein